MSKIGKVLEDYKKLKSDYYALLLKRSKERKGDMRAFVGAKSWLIESENIRNGEDKYTAHISAFRGAIRELRESLAKDNFKDALRSSIEEWKTNGKIIKRESGGRPLILPPIPKMGDWKGNGMTVVSLFSGAMGLDIGFMAAGFELRFANDICKHSEKTVTENLPTVHFVAKDFNEVTKKEILEISGLRVGEVDVLTGGPPCQPFSTAGKRRGLNDPRSSPLRAFKEAIKELRPRAFVMEEVTGLMSSRLKHIPIAERGKRRLRPEEEIGSAFHVVVEMLESTGYKFTYGVLNSADFGSPQVRKRVIFIGLREGVPDLPAHTHTDSKEQNFFHGKLLPWNSFWEATIDIEGCEEESETAKLSDKIKGYLKYVPPGGYWRNLPENMIKKAMGGAYFAGGGKMGFYRRLAWDEPSPTVVTSPIQKGTQFCHPEALRPLSIKEYKRVQGFPDDWEIHGSLQNKYKLVGDAVPVHLSYAVAVKVRSLLKGG